MPAHRMNSQTRPARRGSTAVEFALTLPLMVMSALAVVQLGFFLTERQRFVQGTYEVARFAGVGPDVPTDEEVTAYARHVLEGVGLDAEGLVLTIARAEDAGDDIVTLRMELPAHLIGDLVELPTNHSQQFTVVLREA